MNIRFRLTVIHEYDADAANYADADGDPLAMAEIDVAGLRDEPFLLAEFLEGRDYTIRIELVKNEP